MKNLLALLTLTILITLVGNSNAQEQPYVEDGWKWITPLETKRTEIEKMFGVSITEDKDHPFQTYVTNFGKINIAFATETKYFKEYSCTVKKGTVLNYYISPQLRFRLSDLRYDLTKFERDASASPRELSYFSEAEGILITTEIFEMPDKTNVERVIAIEYRPKVKPL